MDSWMRRGFLVKPKGAKESSPNIRAGSGSQPQSKSDIKAKESRPSIGPIHTGFGYSDYLQMMSKILPFDEIMNMESLPLDKTMELTHLPLDRSTSNESTTSCILYPGTKKEVLAIPGFPGKYRPFLRVHYRIDDAPGAGKGLFAQTNLDFGDLILRERPICMMPQLIVGVGSYKGNQILPLLLSQLSEEDYKSFYALTNSEDHNIDPAWGIYSTNSFSADSLPGSYDGLYSGISLDMSRANHSCVPNARYSWILKDMVYELRALRPIRPGEQIFIAYNVTLLPRSTRQEELQRKYKFNCQCPSCALPDKDSSLSDIRRSYLATDLEASNIHDDDAMLRAWTKDQSLSDDYPIVMSKKALTIMNAEGLVDVNVCKRHYSRLTKAYCALKDTNNARLWARRTAKLLVAVDGDDFDWGKVAELPELLADWWGCRKRN